MHRLLGMWKLLAQVAPKGEAMRGTPETTKSYMPCGNKKSYSTKCKSPDCKGLRIKTSDPDYLRGWIECCGCPRGAIAKG